MTGQELIDMTRKWLHRYAGLTAAQSLTLALWALHTWVYDRLGRTTPYLEITGVSGSGKTTAMEALALLSRGSEILTTIRTMAMCRLITEREGRVTFFVDEAERLESGSFGDQRSMLASGYRRGGTHLVTVGKGTETFSVWCPKAFTSLRTLTPVLHNRCLPVWMERGKPEASLSLEYERAEATAAEVIQLFKGIMANTPHFVTRDAEWLENERDREIWTPLFSLAATLRLHADTMRELTAASVDLSALRGIHRRCDQVADVEGDKERSYAVRLLADVQTLTREWPNKNVTTEELLKGLRAMETAPWRSYQRTGITAISLAQLLGAFGLESTTVRVGKQPPAKGYKVAELHAAKP